MYWLYYDELTTVICTFCSVYVYERYYCSGCRVRTGINLYIYWLDYYSSMCLTYLNFIFENNLNISNMLPCFSAWIIVLYTFNILQGHVHD